MSNVWLCRAFYPFDHHEAYYVMPITLPIAPAVQMGLSVRRNRCVEKGEIEIAQKKKYEMIEQIELSEFDAVLCWLPDLESRGMSDDTWYKDECLWLWTCEGLNADSCRRLEPHDKTATLADYHRVLTVRNYLENHGYTTKEPTILNMIEEINDRLDRLKPEESRDYAISLELHKALMDLTRYWNKVKPRERDKNALPRPIKSRHFHRRQQTA